MNYKLKYSEALNKTTLLEKELRQEKLKKEYLLREVDILNQIINQTKQLSRSSQTQTKLTCKYGHGRCINDHNKYNYVKKTSSQLYDKGSNGRSSTQEQKISMSPVALSRKIDRLQSLYDVPPSLRQKLAEDLICWNFWIFGTRFYIFDTLF